MLKNIFVTTLLLASNPALSLAQTTSEEVMIFSKVISRDQISSEGEAYTVYSEIYEKMNSGDECSKFDEDSTYESYRLETLIQSPSKNNMINFTKWFEGLETTDQITSATIQTCYGIGLKGDIINQN